jgi:hypothetical protein
MQKRTLLGLASKQQPAGWRPGQAKGHHGARRGRPRTPARRRARVMRPRKELAGLGSSCHSSRIALAPFVSAQRYKTHQCIPARISSQEPKALLSFGQGVKAETSVDYSICCWDAMLLRLSSRQSRALPAAASRRGIWRMSRASVQLVNIFGE